MGKWVGGGPNDRFECVGYVAKQKFLASDGNRMPFAKPVASDCTVLTIPVLFQY